MTPTHDIFEWSWVLFILVMIANAVIFRMRAQRYIKLNPELKDGYAKLIKGFLLWGNIPWIVMGVGCTVGGVPSVWKYFDPKGSNPNVIAFYASVLLVWILGSYWILLRDGATELANHPGLFNYDIKSPTVIKLLWIACVLAGIFAVIMMYTQTFPLRNT